MVTPPPARPAPAGPRSNLIPRGHRYSWAILSITTLAILMTAVDGGILPAVLPAIVEEYGITNAQAGLINSVFFAALIIGAIAFGWISDRIGTGYRRSGVWIVAMGIGILGGIATFGLSGAFLAFLLLRIPMGISRGGSEPVNVALVSEWWPKEHRGFAVGVHHTGFPIGQFVTGALIALVLGVAGWREAFLLIPLLGIPIMIAQFVIGRRRQQQQVYDWIDRSGLTRPTEELSVTASGSFVAPVKEALRHRNTWYAIALIFVFLWAETGIATFLTVQFTGGGMDLGTAALIAGASGITGWIGQIGWGWWSDRHGRTFALRVLVIGWALASLAFLLVSGVTSAWIIMLVWGLVRNAPFPVVYALLVDSLPRAAGTAMGLMIGIALGVSGILAAPVQGWIIDTWGFSVHYVVLAVVVLLGLIPLAKITETVRKPAAEPATDLR